MAEAKTPKAHIGKPTAAFRDGGFGRPGLMSEPLAGLVQKLSGRNAEIEKIAGQGIAAVPNLITILQMGTDYNKACALACLLKMEEKESGTALGLSGKGGEELLEVMELRAELITVLRELLKSDGEYVKGYSATLLGRMKAFEAVPEIAEGLESRSHIVRWRCAGALMLMGANSVKEAVKKLNEGKSHMERREARRVLLAVEEGAPGSVPPETMKIVAEQEREMEKRRMGPAWRD